MAEKFGKPVIQDALPPTTRDEFEEILEEGEYVDAQALAREHVKKSIDTLAACMDDVGQEDGPSHAVARGAAKDMIEIAEGKAAQKLPPERGDGNFTINFVSFSTIEEMEQLKANGITVKEETRKAIDVEAEKVGVK